MVFTAARPLSDNVFRIQGHRFPLATEEQAKALNFRRAWDVVSGTTEGMPLGQPFHIPFAFTDGYGFSFAGGDGAVYEIANGFDASAAGKIKTWPKLATCEAFTDTDYRGWIYQDFTTGYMYVLRGRYAVKYAPNPTPGATWAIVEFHAFPTGFVVAGKPAVFGGVLYVPLMTVATGVLERFQALTTVSVTTTEIQTVVISGTPTGGTYTLSFNDGLTTYTTSALVFNASGAAVQAALRLLPGLQKVTVVTTGSTPNFTHTVTMTAAPSVLGTTSPPTMGHTDNTTGGTHAIANATTVAGVGDQWDRSESGIEASYFCTWVKQDVGPVLVRANANMVDSCAAAPLVAANWGGEQPAGDTTFHITAIATFRRLLYVGRPDGLFSFDETGTVINEIPAISSVVDSNNFVGMVESNGALLCPHKLGLIRYTGAAWAVVGAEEDNHFEGEHSEGWGRPVGVAPYGRQTYVTINDSFNLVSSVVSLTAQTGQGARGPFIPHMHQLGTPALEDAAIVAQRVQPLTPLSFLAFSNDSAVGANDWTNPTYAASDDGQAATCAIVGQTHYLKALGIVDPELVPPTSTIRGILVEAKKSIPSTFHTQTLTSTGDVVIPAGVTSVSIDLWGAPGADGGVAISTGGRGGHVSGTLATTPGETLHFHKTGGGTAGSSSGDSSAYVGGDAFDVRQGGDALGNRVAVAAGGGGATDNSASGANGFDGGGTTGSGSTGKYGAGGTASAGGGHGTGDAGGGNGTDGASGTGGNGGTGNNAGGGGGGSGYYGGGGGGGSSSIGGSGGGGSSYTGGLTAATNIAGASSAASATISWTAPSDVVDTVVRLVKAGTVVGSNYAATTTQWPAVAAYTPYGGLADLWGTTWTAAQVIASDFGVVLSATIASASASVEHLRVTIAYDLQSGGDTASYLAVITLDSTLATATTVVYQLPRAGQPVANDPNIDGHISTGAEFRTARRYDPSRAVLKLYTQIDCYLDLDPEGETVITPGVQIQAQVDDSGTWIPLVDQDGQSTFRTSGRKRLYFPGGSMVGRWAQLRCYVAAASASQQAIQVSVRDLAMSGYLVGTPNDVNQAVMVLLPGSQYEDGQTENRTAQAMRDELFALISPDALERQQQAITIHDPVMGRDFRAVVIGQPHIVEHRFRADQPSGYIVTMVFARTGGGQP